MIIIDPAGSRKTVIVDSHVKVGGLWVPNADVVRPLVYPNTDVDEPAQQIVFPDPPAENEGREDVAVRIKYLLDGLRKRPITQGDLAYMEMVWAKERREDHAWCIAFALTNGHRVPKKAKKLKPKKTKKMSTKTKGPSWYDENGKLKAGMPEGAYLRVKTRDEMVELIEHRPLKNGVDWDQSIKLYGPFKSADAQREFMCNAWRGVTKPGPRLDAMIEQTMAWRRFDEE